MARRPHTLSRGQSATSGRSTGAWHTWFAAILALALTVAPAAAQTSRFFPLDRFWSHELDEAIAAPPAADATHVYVALTDGRFTALRPSTGTETWSVDLAVAGPPIAAEGRLFVPDATTIHALDAATGRHVWRLAAGPLAAPLVYRGGWLIVALADGAVQGVRASDGVVMWAVDIGAAASAAPAVDGDLLVLPLTDGRLVALDVRTGAISWARPLGGVPSGVALSGNRVFAGAGDGTFWSLDARSGRPAWRWRVGARFIGAPAVDGSGVYTIAADNIVRGLSRSSGNQRWSHALTTRALSGPVVVDDVVIVTTGEVGRPGLTYLDARTGKPAGRSPALASATDTTRAQHPVLIVSDAAQAILVTATPAGDWAVHAYRQTFLVPTGTEPIPVGKRYDIRWRLPMSTGVRVIGERITLGPQVPRVPRVP